MCAFVCAYVCISVCVSACGPTKRGEMMWHCLDVRGEPVLSVWLQLKGVNRCGVDLTSAKRGKSVWRCLDVRGEPV